jgi:hypothetical protein
MAIPPERAGMCRFTKERIKDKASLLLPFVVSDFTMVQYIDGSYSIV